MSLTWAADGRRKLRQVGGWPADRGVITGYVVTIASLAAAVLITRLSWPFLAHTPFILLFAATFAAAQWGTETAGWSSILLAVFATRIALPRTAVVDDGTTLVFILSAVVLNRIIVARRRAAVSLRASESRFRAMRDNAGLGAALINACGQVECINPAMERILGYPGSAWTGVSFAYFAEEDGTALRARFAASIQSGSNYQEERRFRSADGAIIWCRVTMSFIADGHRSGARGAAMILEDVTAHRRAEQALRASERQYRQLFQDNPHAMWLYEPDTGRFIAVNQAAQERYGYSLDEFQTLALRDLYPPDDRRASDALDRNSNPHTSHYRRHRTKYGRLVDVQVESHLVNWGGRQARLEIIDDVTEQKQLEARIRQTQKLEALGQLSGGVAHEFKNLLTAIQGYSELLLAQVGTDTRIRQDLHEIEMAAMRAATLTSQLLTFSRQQVVRLRVIDVNAVVSGLTQLARQLIPEDIDITIETGDGMLHVKGDVVQLEQVLLNLAINARDAVPRPGGWIRIRTWRDDAKVFIEVADNGAGMDVETKARLFEPFFTTKPPGEGTGLGLAVVYGIVKEFGGDVDVESEPGRGATFRVSFAATDEPVAPSIVAGPTVASLVGSERILVVEDDAQMRGFVTAALRRYGYSVVEAGSPEEALAIRDEIHLDAIVTDVVMPRVSGPRVVAELKVRRPQLQVLYMSGHGAGEVEQHGLETASAELIEKPFSSAELLARVRRLFDREAVRETV